MKPKALVFALTALSATLPGLSQAAEAVPQPTAQEIAKLWADMFVYAVTPSCQVMSNGLRVCQPIGLVGPKPTAGKPGLPSLTPVPLAAPSVQAPAGMTNPYMPGPYAPQPFVLPQPIPLDKILSQMQMPTFAPPRMPTSPYAVPQYQPQPFQPQQYLPPQFVPMQPSPAPAMPAQAKPAIPPSPAASIPVAPAPAISAAPTPAVPATPAPATTASPAPAALPAQPTPAPAPTAASQPAAAPAAMETIVVHFAFDSAELDASGRLVLDAWLLQGGSRDRQIRITGYADRLGPEPYNLLLSKQRAEAVQRYLADKGMKTENLEILALGEQHPVVRCKGGPTPATKACLAPNRRAEISTR